MNFEIRTRVGQIFILWLLWMVPMRPQPLLAGDWPQILGPNRNGVAEGERLRRDWGNDTPDELWQRDVGEGLAGVAVAKGRVIVFHRPGDEQVVEALSVDSGKILWKHQWPTHYQSRISTDSGPRCVPLVHQDAVYVHSAEGHLVCLGLADGKLRWQRNTAMDFGVLEGYFGVGSTPIVAANLLLLNVGGRGEGGIVAFTLDEGKTVWQVGDERASYSSPTLAQLDGVQHALFVTRYNFIAIEPESGNVRFRIPFGQRGPTVNGATPVVMDKHVFLSASYGIGARWLETSADGANVEWSRDDLMSSQYCTSVRQNGTLYGIDGRQDGAPGNLRAFDPALGKLHWSEERFGMATLIRAEDTLLVMKTDGQLVLVDATPDQYHEFARWQLLNGTTRALPALSEGRLYVRNENRLECFDLRGRK
ncbi:MAG: PQQ-binding-like beta-propeller repeat protein [Pirellulales bacterium]